MKPIVRLLRLGNISYLDALKVQRELAANLKAHVDKGANLEHTLILLEHMPVYTIGIRTKGYGPEDEDKLKKLGR